MAEIAYIRVSSTDQNSARQLAGTKIQFDKTFEDKCTGSTQNRPALQQMLEYSREGDTIHVHSIDRLARNLADLMQLIQNLNSKSVTLHFHSENLVFDGESNPFQELQMQIIGAVVQFERTLIKERQREGIEKAKTKGVYRGRQKSIDRSKVAELKANGMGPSAIAAELNISRMSVHRILKSAG
ncbi:recombinase family protein [Terasakiella pusilla]|uniref:recombinase family protein n=1 Tax=Terasakiella pusilla TaxID=64973 RepID=UPI00048D8484|nr:recombinase family protein [Terasakiella pusilla]